MGEPSQASLNLGIIGHMNMEDEYNALYRSTWYLSKEEIEKISPSRNDGIDLRKESQLRKLYCSFLRDIGIKLGLPQVTIATAIMFCHRFYLHQSHAKNDWQTVATACMFLASKVEETPCGLEKIVVVAYEIMYHEDQAAARRIRQKGILERQKRLILIGERVLLPTIRFDFNVLHPYKPLLDALNKLGINQKEVRQAAWSYVNDCFWTTLCLQYKPHYIAAGSLFIAAMRYNFKLPSERGYVWWHEFEVNPRLLNEVIQQMNQLFKFNRNYNVAPLEKSVQDPIARKNNVGRNPDSVLNRTGSLSSSSCQEPVGDRTSHKTVDSTNHFPATVSSTAREQSATEHKTESQMSGEIAISVAEHNETLGNNVDQAWTRRVQIRDRVDYVEIDRINRAFKKQKREREENE